MATRLGIIGAGIMGERMIRAATEADSVPAEAGHHGPGPVEIGPVWDAAPAALDRLSSILPTRAASAADVIAASDCVYVATPPGTHLAYAGQALSAGRAVFLEKPLATDVVAAEAFARLHGDARVAVNFPFASSLAVEQLAGWIAERPAAPGDRLDIRVAFRTWPRPWQQGAAAWLDSVAEGGFTREVVSHFLFLAVRQFGPLLLREASVSPGPSGASERAIAATLVAERSGMEITLSGGVGTTEADDHNTWTVSRPGADTVRLRDWSFAERQPPGGAWHAAPGMLPNERMRPLVLRRQLEAVDRMTRGEPHRLATVAEALAVQRIVEAILAGTGHA